MATRFRTMLAPIGVSTGDGRRFGADAMSLADLPMPFEWARSREGGHDGAVVVGVVQEASIATVKEALAAGWVDEASVKGWDRNLSAIWGSGQLFDDADRETMPRLAEDVAEAMHLIGAGTLGPSVDLDSFEGVPVMEGTDDPVTWEQIENYYAEHGEEPKLELLITQGRVRAATLVSIPAFMETSRPLELIPAEEGEAAADVLALTASIGGRERRPPVAFFDPMSLAAPTEVTFDRKTGHVFGHLALWSTCHVGFEGVCVTPPREAEDYSWFNRYAVETEDGTVWAGRLTAGGRHAGLSLAASAAMAVHDQKATVAHVKVYPDAHGIAFTGVLEPDLDARTWAILDRRKLSGDWRETPGGLTLVEILALSDGPRQHSEPGFPIETFSRHGRQVALTAALGPQSGTVLRAEPLDIAGEVRRALAEDRAAQAAEAEKVAARAALAAVLSEEADLDRAALIAALTTQEG